MYFRGTGGEGRRERMSDMEVRIVYRRKLEKWKKWRAKRKGEGRK